MTRQATINAIADALLDRAVRASGGQLDREGFLCACGKCNHCRVAGEAYTLAGAAVESIEEMVEC